MKGSREITMEVSNGSIVLGNASLFNVISSLTTEENSILTKILAPVGQSTYPATKSRLNWGPLKISAAARI